MERKTLDALKASIKKWDKNSRTIRLDHLRSGSHECPLCLLFNIGNGTPCVGCPVYAKTGETYCHETPYTAFGEAHDEAFYANTIEKKREAMKDIRRLSKLEAEFLRSLLPENASE